MCWTYTNLFTSVRYLAKDEQCVRPVGEKSHLSHTHFLYDLLTRSNKCDAWTKLATCESHNAPHAHRS